MNYLKTFLPYLFGNKKGKSLDFILPQNIPWDSLSFEETLMFHALKNSINSFVSSLNLSVLTKKDIFQLFNFLDFIDHDLKIKITSAHEELFLLYCQSIKARALSALEMQELLDFKNQKLTVFALLKTDRRKPGILIIRDRKGQFLKNKSQDIWSIPILGLSSRGLGFNHSNGYTPGGIFTIDSVMPLADKFLTFGKFRRLILNFIPESPKESDLLKFLPYSHHHLDWWKPSVVGRELGRHLLRIHGTGLVNWNPFIPYYPFVATSGCLATRESNYFGIKRLEDQRLLLDALLEAQDLPKLAENESKIHGLLYVVEFDDSLGALRLA